MLEKYKGDAPENVLTPQEANEKKPFYKNWKFWVLSALISLFGFCSVYGFVLGSRYVNAIQEAANVIADAQETKSEGLKKTKICALNDTYVIRSVNLGLLTYTNPNSNGWFRSIDPLPYVIAPSDNNTLPQILCASFTTGTPNTNWTTSGTISIGMEGSVQIRDDVFIGLTNSQAKSQLAGIYAYYKATGGASAQETAYNQGYSDGYEEGHSDGYEEGYDDGYEALAGSQTIQVTFDENFPKLNDIHYSWAVDGSVVDSGTINVRPNVQIPLKTFTRPGGYTHTAELNLWSENDEPLIIAYGRHEGLVIGGQQTYVYDTYNKTNAYEFGENSRYVWYVPTYWPNALFYIYSYGTWNQGYANDCYFEFDPGHNERSKVGAYADGYNDGYHDATESGDAFDAGKEIGYGQGYQTGVTDGRNQGYAEATGGTKALAYMFVTAFQQPFDQLYRFLNFNLLGINLLALFSALVTLSLGIYVLKKVL